MQRLGGSRSKGWKLAKHNVVAPSTQEWSENSSSLVESVHGFQESLASEESCLQPQLRPAGRGIPQARITCLKNKREIRDCVPEKLLLHDSTQALKYVPFMIL